VAVELHDKDGADGIVEASLHCALVIGCCRIFRSKPLMLPLTTSASDSNIPNPVGLKSFAFDFYP
jgi:hypothetical protein